MTGAIPALRAAHVLLRQPEPRDVVAIRRLGCDAEVERMYGHEAEPQAELTQAQAEAIYRELVSGEDPYLWAIEVEGAYVGTAFLHSLEENERRASYAIGIQASRYLGRGFGTEATRLVLAYAFEVLKLHRIVVKVLDFNVRAIACYRKCGFVEEGRERECALLDGAWHDDVIMGLLEHEYREASTAWLERDAVRAAARDLGRSPAG
jgi:RimJ/RimL family protein N-acetyltransferase